MDQHHNFMHQAIRLAEENIPQGGGPFGAIIVKDNDIIGTGTNQVTNHNDPTAHAEIMAIRTACTTINDFSLTGCILYSSCEPCPMCLSAIYWARISKLYFGASHKDAGKAGFRDDFLYEELNLPPHERSLEMAQIKCQEALTPFDIWRTIETKILY